MTGWGHALPPGIVTNGDWERRLDTTSEWIVERTGIHSRRVGGTTVSLAVEAAQASLDRAERDARDLGLIVVATTTPDRVIPTTSTDVAGAFGVSCGAFDVSATCAGFVYALVVAFTYCASVKQPVLVIGADTVTRLADPEDRSTAVLFGDGAGALLLEPNGSSSALLSWDLGSDADATIMNCELGGFVYMAGKEVFVRAVQLGAESAKSALKDAGLSPSDVDLFVPHQANRRIMDALARRLAIPSERVASVIEHTGNTSAASVPMALSMYAEDGHLAGDDVVLLNAFGGGMTIASAVLRWPDR